MLQTRSLFHAQIQLSHVQKFVDLDLDLDLDRDLDLLCVTFGVERVPVVPVSVYQWSMSQHGGQLRLHVPQLSDCDPDLGLDPDGVTLTLSR